MNTVNLSNTILCNHQLHVEQGQKNQVKGTDLKIKKVVLIVLAVLVAALAVSASLAFFAALSPFVFFASCALVAFKVIATITVIAVAIFAITQALNLIAPKLPRPLALVANGIHALITEFFAFIAMSSLYFINLEKRNPKIIEGNHQQPILLIHGLYHNSSAWIAYKKCLQDANTGPVFTINLANSRASIETHAQKVKKMVAEIQRVTGRQDIMLVGHSMGGLVASKFALDLATKETKVTDVITIGSPLKGSPTAKYIGFGKSVKEMQKNSVYMKDLSTRICKQRNIHFFHIASRTDELVPATSALLTENVRAKHLLLSNVGHAGLLYSKRVINPIIEYYKNRQLER